MQLRPIAAEAVWYGDPATWTNSAAIIAPAQEYKAEKNTACWFPGAQTAHVWQSVVIRKPLLRIVAPLPQVDQRPLSKFGASERISVSVAADAVVPNGRIEIYDAATHLAVGELKDRKATLEIGPLQPGIHTLIVRTPATSEMVAISRPVTVLVVAENTASQD